jgi:hypothetical protein
MMATTNEHLCSLPGCGQPVAELRGQALGRLCRPHLERLRRHGCAWLGTYKASDLNAYRRAAWDWLSENEGFLGARLTTGVVSGLIARGSLQPIRQVVRQNAEVKAAAIWGRFAELNTEPKIIAAAILAVWLRVAHDHSAGRAPSGAEYRDVQTAKLLLRLAGGSVRRWPPRREGGQPIVLKSFVSSEGRVLRVLGRSAAEGAQSLSAGEWEALRAHVAAFISSHSGRAVAPYPQSVRVKHKPRLTEDVKPPQVAATPPLFAPDPDGGAPRRYVLNDDGSLSRLK